MNVHEYNKGIALPEGAMLDLEREEKRSPPSCLSGWFIMQRHVDHFTTYCCRIPTMMLDDSNKLSLKELWYSQKMMNMRLLGKYGHIQKMYKVCQTCPFYSNNIERSLAVAQESAY
jgi:MoaA/NifB/PqqE/SkfB family radical SAM enzyme